MAQHDFNIDNQSAPAFRGDLNNALEALGTLSSGATAPATTYAGMIWHDTAANTLYIRSDADDAWIALGTLDQSANTFAPAGVAELTQVQVEDDTSTVFGQVSGERLSQAVAANANGLGVAQTQTDVKASRSANTAYQNTTGKPIFVSISMSIVDDQGNIDFQTSPDGVSYVTCIRIDTNENLYGSENRFNLLGIVQDDDYYRVTISSDFLLKTKSWTELR